jgi:hypothetical protein
MDIQENLATKFIFNYFKCLGLHKIKTRKFKYFSTFLGILFLISWALGIYFATFQDNYESVIGVVSVIECELI